MPSKKLIGSLAMTAALAGGGLVGATLGNPLGVSAQTSPSTTTTPGTAPGGPGPGGGMHRGPFGGPGVELEAAAKVLNLTTDELRSQLESGKTLAQIAEAQGVDRQTLIDALVAAAKDRLAEVEAQLPDRIADMVDHTFEGRGGPRGPFGSGPGFEAAAKALGISTDDLMSALRDGKSIADVAKEKGVDVQKVIDALVTEAKAKLDQAVEDGKLTQDRADEMATHLTERITAMVNGEHPRGPGGPGGPGFGPHDDADGGPGGN